MVTEGEQGQSDGNASFLRAARAGNLEKVLEYLKGSIDINTSNANGLNALHLASKEGHVSVVTELVKRGANVNAATKKGNTALHIASLAGQEEVVKILVRNGANVNVQSQNGFTPLYMAAQENHDVVVKFLLANGANQSLATEDGFTPLAVALQQGHDKVVAVLLENDAKGRVRLPALHIAAKKDDCKAAALLLQNDHDPDVTSKSGFTPLHIAAHYGNENIANLLLEKHADVNFSAKHQITPLHVAAKWGKSNMVTLLVDKGGKIDSSTRDGLTPLHCAARSGHDQVVILLLEKGAPITAKTKNGLAPLHMASQGDHVGSSRILLNHRAPVDDVTVDYLTALHVAAHCGHVRVAKLLLDHKADANARALNGFTPLHIACKKNRIKVVELLLKHGASIEATTESGLTPLHVASFMGCMNIVIYLIQHGANPDVPTVRGETPLHLAARANQSDIIRILLRNGAHVDASAREQQTPLHIAARLGNVDIVGLLLQHGAAVDATTKDMYTALHIAAKEGQEEVASVLLDHGASLTATTKKGFTPLHLAAKYGNIKVARLLLQKDAPVDSQGKNGVTPLHVAAHYDHVNVALLLLDKGAFPHATAKNGYTPLHIAAKKNQMDIATTLLEYGAKPNAESKAGFTPLHLAAQEGHTDMTTLLIEHHADVNSVAKNGLVPLHLCAQEDRVNVAAILVKNGAEIGPQTKAGYTPLHVACHFGQMNMIRFLLQHGADVNAITSHGYTPLHQAAQQGHTLIIDLLLEHKASPNTTTNQGQTALSIAQRLGYVSVVETLKIVTETIVTTTTTTITEEKYKVVAPETMQETFMSDSEDEGAEETMLGDQSFRYLTADEMKSLGDDSLPIDVTRDERGADSMLIAPLTAEEEHLTPQHIAHQEMVFTNNIVVDNVDIGRAPVHAGKLKWKTFLVSFMVDARGGAMRGCRHSGVRVIIPPRKAPMPMRITCRYLRKEKLAHPPPLMEGEACASRILEVGPAGVKFLGPVIIEVPHFAALRGREREITILRSDNGESWREHTLEASEDAVHDVFNESFEGEELNALEDLNTNRITRILTTDFPQYFAIITRIRQEVHAIGPEGGMVSSTVVPQVQAIFPEGALTKKIKVGLQAQPIPPELVTKLLGNRVAVSPIVTVEPRRRKFHKPITLTIPVPQAATKGMINQYSGDTPTLRLLCSITGSTKTGGTTKAQWEDVTGSTPLSFVHDCVSFTTTVSARFWLMDCRQVNEATKFATELYREAIHVPFMAKFVVFAKRHDPMEAQLRVFCMTDDKEDKTLECQEHFTEVAKSRDVEVLEAKSQYLEFAGNLVPVTKSGEQLSLTFQAFRENRLPFTIRVKDPHQEPLGRVAFMREPRVGRGEPPQTPICNLNIALPEADITPVSELVTLEKKYGFVEETGLAKPELIHRADLRLSDIAQELREDWVPLALQLDILESDINSIRSESSDSVNQQALNMLRLWLQKAGNKATGNSLEKGLRKINREDIVNQCMFNVELVTDDVEKAVAKVHLDQSGFDTFKEELGPSRDASLRRETSLDGTFDERDIMKEAESAAETSSEGSDKDMHFRLEDKDTVTNAEPQKIEREILEDGTVKQIITTVTNATITEVSEDIPHRHQQTVQTVVSETWTPDIPDMNTSQVSVSSLPEDEKSELTTATLSTETTAELEVSSSEDKPQTETHIEKKEWTETDQSGSIRQVTEIKTETSIKVGGEGIQLKDHAPKSESSPEAKKEKTPESEEEMLSFVEKRNFFQRLSLTSETLPLTSKCWTQDVSLDDLPMAEGEIVKEQISFEDKLKMFEPDEENVRRKTQKKEKQEQPTVYRYDFTKQSKEQPPGSEFVVSELEKAEQIVKQVREELNAEEKRLKEPDFSLNSKEKSSHFDSFTLEKVEQEVSSLLAEVDKEEQEMSDEDMIYDTDAERTKTYFTSDSKEHFEKEDNGSMDYGFEINKDGYNEDGKTEETEKTSSKYIADYQEGTIIKSEEQFVTEKLVSEYGESVTLPDSDQMQSEKKENDEITGTSFLEEHVMPEQPSAVDKSPVTEISASSFPKQLSSPSESVGIDVTTEPEVEKDAKFILDEGIGYSETEIYKMGVISYSEDEVEMGTKYDGTSQDHKENQESEKHVSWQIESSDTESSMHKQIDQHFEISTKVNSQIKSQILHEELDQSMEESPLEIKEITEDVEQALVSEADREKKVYKHIRTEIFSQELGEDIESGSPERKDLSSTVPTEKTSDTIADESLDLQEDSFIVLNKTSDNIILTPEVDLVSEMCTAMEQESQIAWETSLHHKEESSIEEEALEQIVVEHDDYLKEYEEAKDEHSLSEQLLALASGAHVARALGTEEMLPCNSDKIKAAQPALEHMFSKVSSSLTEAELHRRSDTEIGYSRADKKEMRSLKSTKKVSTIEEHSSVESSCDSPQELAPQEIMKPDTVIRKDSCEDGYEKEEDMLSRDSTYENLEKIDCKKDGEPFGTTEEHIISGEGESDTPEEKFPADEIELEKFLDLEEPSSSYENQMDSFFGNTMSTKIETYSLDEESKMEQNIFVKEMNKAFSSKHKIPQDESKSTRDERKSDSDYENKSDNVGLIATEQVTPHRKEESFSSSGETESHYYSVETSENGRTPQSTPAASRPCSSEFEINILSGHGSEYETCATSQDASGEVSGSYATAVTSQETSYSTACSSLSHSSRESAYSVDSESSGHLASVEVSSEASETLVPSAQEMELEFAQDIEMPILDEESPSSECMVKEPYDMEIPESVIRSGVELPFLKSWDLEERSFDEKNKAIHDQWTWQYAHESELLDTLQEATSRHVEDIKQDVEALAMKGSVAEHDVQQQLCSHDSVVDFGPVYFTAHSSDSGSKHNGEKKYSDDEGKSKDIDDTYDMNQSIGVNVSKDDRPFVYVSEAYSFKTESAAAASQEMDDSVEQVSTCIDEEQLSVSESSATHSEQTWQTSSIDTAVHISCQIPTSCYISDAQSSMPAVDLLPDIPPDRLPDSEQIQISDDGPLDPTPQPSIDMPSYLQLNGPIEVDYNPEYDTPDGDESAVRISENLASYQLQSEIAGFEIEGENGNSRVSQALDASTNLASSPQLESILPSVSQLENGELQLSDQDTLRTVHCAENISQTTLSGLEDFRSGRALETEKPEAQQEQPDNYRDYDEHLGSGVLFHDEAIFLPESDQCNLRTHFEEQSDILQTDAQDQTEIDMSRNLVVEEPSFVVHTEQNGNEENVGDKVGLAAKLQSGDSLEKTDVVDTSPEDERYDYKIQKSRNEQNYSIRQTSDYEVSLEWQNDSFKPGVEFVDSGSSDKTEACDKVSSSDKTLLPHFDDLTYAELYTHQEEDEENLDFELKEADRQQSPAPSAEEDKQSTPSFDILPGRRFFGRSGEHDDSSASSLQEFERLEAEMGTGRSSQGSGDSGDRPVASKSGEHDDISMCSLTEFEKLERECAEAEQVEKNIHDEAARLSEIEEGHESQASDSQETLSDAGQDHESDDSDDYEKRMTEIDEIIRMAQNNVEKFQEETADDLSEAITLEEYTVTQKTYTSSGNSTESSLVDRSPSPKKRQTSNEKGAKGHGAMGEHESMLENEYKLLHLEGKKELDVSCSDNVEVARDELTASVTRDATEDVELWIESGKVNTDIEETEILTDSLEADNGGGGHDSSSSGGKNGGSGKGDCMVSSTDSLDPSSSTATHATYQFETDSVMSSSINSAQASGEECTMVSSTDTLEPEPKITYSQGEAANEEKITVSGVASDTNVRISSHEVVDDQSVDQIEAVKPTQKFEWSVQTESHTSEYDIDETMKGFLKRTGKPTAESEHITSESQFHVVTSMSGDAEKISKDFLLALEKLETAQNIGQFEQADKDGKVVKVTQQVLIEPAEIQTAIFSGPGTHEQMEMFLKKLTDETEENTTHIVSGSFPHVASEYVEKNDAGIQDQQSSSASFSTPFSSVTESSHYSTPCDPSSLPLDLAQSSEASFGFCQPDEGTAVTDDVVSRTTTTTTTRIVTTLSADDQEQPQDTQEGGDELRQSMEEILNQFMTEEESSQAAPSSQSQQKQ